MPKQARPCIDQVTIPSEESAVTSKVCSVKRLRRLGLQTPRNGIDFDMHSCFLLKELRSLYATHWVAPIVWPYKHDGFLRSCDFHSFSDVFPASPASEFSPCIMIVTVSGDPYSPDVTDVHLPKNFREFAGCASPFMVEDATNRGVAWKTRSNGNECKHNAPVPAGCYHIISD
ncbi:hypothetical protein WJX82_001155 [Trebouxia sp. C0006]